jgi:hypothetical protein
MHKIIPAAMIAALLFLLWGLGITSVMAQNDSPAAFNTTSDITLFTR